MINLQTYNRLKEAVEKRQTEADKASGAFDQALAQLKKDFGVESIEEAKALLAELETAEQAAATAFNKKLKEFEGEFADVLNR